MKLDFFEPAVATITKNQKSAYVIYPDFLTKPSKDLMTRGGKFYAVYDPSTGFWTQDEYKIQEFVDEELYRYSREDFVKKYGEDGKEHVSVRDMLRFRSKSWTEYKTYVSNLPDNFKQLDDRLCFQDQEVTRKDYISKCLPYKLEPGSYDAWDELIGTLYSESEKEKLEWAIGSIIAGDSKSIQKFVVLYGNPGAGKGTFLNILQKLFVGYYEMFDAKSLSSSSNAFAFEQFRSNPLVAIQTDGDLSRIEDNTKINALTSHETIVMNEKRKQSYNFTPHCFLFMASNKPVQITDGKSGILRRLIDVNPTGKTLPKKEYDRLMGQIGFQLGGIAWHCLEVYRSLGKNYYNGYKPTDMMERTNAFYNFVEDNVDLLTEDEAGISLETAYSAWNSYCQMAGLEYKLPRYKFKEELKNYFNDFVEVKRLSSDLVVRGWFCGGLNLDKFKSGQRGRKDIPHNDPTLGLVLDQKVSLLDEMLKDCQAQYGEEKPDGGSKPRIPWDECQTTLKNIDTSRLHFVRLPKDHIVIDFDLKNEKGEKDALLNLEAADKWPKTYAEYSQGGKGVHLHYVYAGDPEELKALYADGIEIKISKGKSSLRRRLSLCNNIPVATISSGLPKKEVVDNLLDFEAVKDEQHLRNIVSKCLRKDIQQPYTTTAMNLVKKTLEDAYNSGLKYDITDMRPAIKGFACKSTHQKETCMKIAEELHYKGKVFETLMEGSIMASKPPEEVKTTDSTPSEKNRSEGLLNAKEVHPDIVYISNEPSNEELPVFFDIEVFPNLLLVNWKEAGEGKGVVRMINPSSDEVRALFHKKLIGFNCRRYDNHILYARSIGRNIPQLYEISQRIIAGSKNAMMGQAYDISYTDVYDFAAKKQSLKKWEIELGIHHQELGLPWDQPVPEERWPEVAAYCDNDVIATEAVFNHLAGDFKAREILADIAGMKVNDTTNSLTTKIIFGDDPAPQRQFVYPDLKKKFPGYVFENGKSFLNGVEIGEGGRVYAVPGIHHHVTTYDVASMHPSSIIAENGFGKYTERFKQLLDIRIAIKHKDFEKAKTMLDGKLAKYLTDKNQAKALSQALKIAINSVYGLTAAGFENKFRDPRNVDNWVAKRGALFIETLRLDVTKLGGKVVHIKTDSIKVEDPTPEITNYILDFGKQWGYTFEVEDIYEKMCLVNDAVYVALRDREDPSWKDECEKAKKKAEETNSVYQEPTRWTATGAQFQHPYVFKHLFSGEEVTFRDLCETKTVTSALYLDMNENLSDVTEYEKNLDKLVKRAKALLKAEGYFGSWEEWPEWRKQNPDAQDSHGGIIYGELDDLVKDQEVLKELIAKGHNYIFVGKAGCFCPVLKGTGGGILVREKDGKFNAATGSKGFRWRESESISGADRMNIIDMGYFENLARVAKEAIETYGDFDVFVTESSEVPNYISIDEEAEKAAKKYGEPGVPSWLPPCGDGKYANCYDCPHFDIEKIPPECRKGYDLTEHFTINV